MNIILVGAQWGDEGKGKIIDVLTREVDVVVRCQGGNNAGHTVEVGKEKFVLQLIPSGILWPKKTCVIGNGVVIDMPALVKEIEGLHSRGIKTRGRLFLSETAHLVFPYHRRIDECRESRKGKIGTTKRGIGPAYGDKAARVGIRLGDTLKPDYFRERLKERIEVNNITLKAFGAEPLVAKQVIAEYQQAAKFLQPYLTNTVVWLHEALKKKRTMLFEGAQGTFLDIDFGSYPYVTSSNTTAGGASTGSGIPPHRMDRVVGCMKAYTTRVGEGALPTESEELGDHFHNMGREFGANTKRPRRCGWFDSVATRYAQMVNGFDELAVTNLDGLDTMAAVKVCVAYEVRGKRLKYPPVDFKDWDTCKPVYRTFKGWRKDTSGVREYKQLPVLARDYLTAIADLTGAPLKIVSVGAQRDATLWV